MWPGVNNRAETYTCGTSQPNEMLCYVVPKVMRVDPHHDIRSIGMLPKVRPNPAYEQSDSVKVVLQCVNGAGTMVLLCPNKPCGREQIVPL